MTNNTNFINFFKLTPEQSSSVKSKLKPIMFSVAGIFILFTILWGIGGVNATTNALNHANLSKNEVSFIRFQLDIDDFIPQYEVSWYQGMNEMEYTVHAFSGQLMEIDWD